MANDKQDSQIVDWFRASTAYINAHREKTFVIFLGGEALADQNLPNLVFDFSLLHSLGVKLVLVHGARPQISAALEAAGENSQFSNDLRVTEAEFMQSITATVGNLSAKLDALFSMGLRDSPMHGSNINVCRGNFVTGKPVGVVDGIDFHYTGKVRKIQTDAINQQLDSGNIVLLSNLGYSVTGEVFNLSAEEIATETAIALNADKLIFLVPSSGVLDASGNLVPSLTEKDAKQFIEKLSDQLKENESDESLHIAHALTNALKANSNSVHRTHLISYKENGALLLELFTREGRGSLVSSDSIDQLRQATIEDVGGIISLISPLEEAGTLVPRSRELLENEIANFQVIELEETIIACAALYPVTEKSAEIACIAIHPSYQKNGLGQRLLESLEQSARENNVAELFSLTTEAAHFFLENGYQESKVEDLPEARQQLYNLQRKSKVMKKSLA